MFVIKRNTAHVMKRLFNVACTFFYNFYYCVVSLLVKNTTASKKGFSYCLIPLTILIKLISQTITKDNIILLRQLHFSRNKRREIIYAMHSILFSCKKIRKGAFFSFFKRAYHLIVVFHCNLMTIYIHFRTLF